MFFSSKDERRLTKSKFQGAVLLQFYIRKKATQRRFQHPISLKKYRTNINQYPKKDQEHPVTKKTRSKF